LSGLVHIMKLLLQQQVDMPPQPMELLQSSWVMDIGVDTLGTWTM
jgi:hypothetical protein